MSNGSLRFEKVSFYYPAAGAAVFEGLSVRLGGGWTGVIGPNGSGKTTLLRLACGELAATAGRIHAPDGSVYCPQRTDDPPEDLDLFLQAADAGTFRLRGQLGVEEDWPDRWDTLSHGERKRAQIAVALWRRPDLLAIDEPTNHLDLPARTLLGDALQAFDGVGLLVSHDRELLDRLCMRTLFIEPTLAVLRPGGYSKAVQLARQQREDALRAHAQVKAELKRLQREAARRREEASRSHQKRSRRRIPRKDHDAMERVGRARLTGKDTQAGRVLRQMDGRVEHARRKLADIRISKRHRLGVRLSGAQSQRNALLRLPAGSVQLGPDRRLVHPELLIRPDDRIALIGPNGSGKSTLIRHVVERLDLPKGRLVYIAQEIDAAASRKITAAARRLRKDRLGEVMTIVSCLGSRPQPLMETELPSPGELRKLMLAVGMANDPHLIVMDEPTNHLDLPSIECLESALADCPSALLLVSHDLRLLDTLTRTRWAITKASGDADTLLRVVRHARPG